MNRHQISSDTITLSTIEEIIKNNKKVELSDSAKQKVQKCRQYLDDRMASGQEVIYGINTGFGSLCNTVVSRDELGQLQHNLVMSHACGLGEEVPEEDDLTCQECAPKRTLPDPGQPTQQQLEDHRVDHLPFRSWCPRMRRRTSYR